MTASTTPQAAAAAELGRRRRYLVLANPQQREVLTLAMNIEQALPDLLEQR